jgi:hypothetical protein
MKNDGALYDTEFLAEVLGMTEPDVCELVRKHAATVGTMRTNDNRWFVPSESLEFLRSVARDAGS